MPKLHHEIHVNASPAEVWAVLGDLAAVDAWIEGIEHVHVEGMKRVCTFAGGAVQHEDIADYSPETHSFRYRIEGGPLPLTSNQGSFAVHPNQNGSVVVWDAEVEAADPAIMGMLESAYQQTLERLRDCIELRSAPADDTPDAAYEAIIDAMLDVPGVNTGKMFNVVGLKTSGKVFAMLVKGRLVVKLPRDRVRALIDSGAAAPVDPGHGRVMKEWAALHFASRDEWRRLADEARIFVDALARGKQK